MLPERCDAPSRYRYQRGCRCSGCKEAAAVYKRTHAEAKAAEEGRGYGQKPCAMCGTPISTLNGANRKTYCTKCAVARNKDQRAKDRAKRSEEMRLYLREYYRANKATLRIKHREYYEATRPERLAQYRKYRVRNAERLRTYKREAYTKKNTPTVHERALEAFNFRTSGESNGKVGNPSGFRLRYCKCGCGLPVNAAHIAVARLTAAGWSRKDIATRLGVHPTEISYLRLDGEARAWAWYRRGHANLLTVKKQPPTARRRLSAQVELRLLMAEQRSDGDWAKTSGRSLDATIAGTEGLTLGAVVVTQSKADFTLSEESLFDWLHGMGLDLDEVARRCAGDSHLTSLLANAAETGVPSALLQRLLSEQVAS